MLDIIILVVCTFFIVSRLIKVLGQVEPDEERRRQQRYNSSVIAELLKQKHGTQAGSNDNINPNIIDAQVIAMSELKLSQEIRSILNKIRQIDSNFDLDRFINNTKKAYTMIVKAMHDSDKETLRYLLDDDTYNVVLENLESQSVNDTVKTSALNVNDVELIQANIYGDRAMLTVKIESQWDDIITDNQQQVKNKVDIWTFTRYLVQDKIWRLSKMQ